jgi:hypothetical protein
VCANDCNSPSRFGNLWRKATARGKRRWFGVATRVGDYDWGTLEASPLADHADGDRQELQRLAHDHYEVGPQLNQVNVNGVSVGAGIGSKSSCVRNLSRPQEWGRLFLFLIFFATGGPVQKSCRDHCTGPTMTRGDGGVMARQV